MFVVLLCPRFQDDPKLYNFTTAKIILRYLKSTPGIGLWYSKNSSFNLICHSNADYACYKIDRNSTSRSYQFLGDKLILWFSKKHNSIVTSTTEAEYLAVDIFCAQRLRIQQLRDHEIQAIESSIFCENTMQ